MTDAALGFLLALVSSAAFAAYIFPRKSSRLSVVRYQYYLSLAVAPLCVAVALVADGGIDFRPLPAALSFACGVIWTFGSLSYSTAVDYIGVARSTPVKNMAPFFASVYGIVIFHEYTFEDPKSLVSAVGGVMLMTLAAVLLGRAGAPETERAIAFQNGRDPADRKRAFAIGILASFGAAFFYGAYAIPLKVVLREGMTAYQAVAWLGVGVLASSMLLFWVRERRWSPRAPRREVALCLTAGGIWMTGQTLGTVAMVFIPMSISWPVSNLSTLIAIAWGVWVLREVHLDSHKREVGWSLLSYAVGLALLAFAAPAGHV